MPTSTLAAVAADPSDEFASCSYAMTTSGMGRSRIASLAAAGRVRVMVVPGAPVRYHLGDVLAIARAERSRVGRPRGKAR